MEICHGCVAAVQNEEPQRERRDRAADQPRGNACAGHRAPACWEQSGARQRRDGQAGSGERCSPHVATLARAWKWVLVLCFAALPSALMQQCAPEYIAFPREQCTEPCPAPDSARCGYDTTMYVERGDTSYCCLCVPSGQGQYQPFLCPGSAQPRPASPKVAFNGTITGLGGEAWDNTESFTSTVLVPQGTTALTSFVSITPQFEWSKNSMEFLEISVVDVVRLSYPPNSTIANASTGPRAQTQGAHQLLSEPGQWQQRLSSINLHALSNGVVAQYAVKGINGGEPRHMYTDLPVKLHGSGSDDSAAGSAHVPVMMHARRALTRAVDAAWLDWYLLDADVPKIDAPVPFFLIKGLNEGRAPIMHPRSAGSESKVAYVMGLRGVQASYKATVKATVKSALDLKDGVRTIISMEANERIFTYYTAPSGLQAGLVFLDIKVDTIVNASVSMYVGVNYLSTARKWVKWVGGTDSDVNNMQDRFYTSNLIVAAYDHDYTSWTFECTKASSWSVEARVVRPQTLEPDVPRQFSIEAEIGVTLFMMNPKVNQSRLFFQLMPSSSSASRGAYLRWEDLQAACRVMAATKVNGEWAYYQLSDWGYTTDGTPGLQVMVSQWDSGATVYFQVYLRTAAPNNAFTVVCYIVDDAYESWKWWFGGIFFALFIFCMARCVLCRSPQGNYFLGRRQGWARRRDGAIQSSLGGIMSGGREMQRVSQLEIATTTQQPPSKLKKVGDTLYSRSEDARNLQQAAAAVGPLFSGADDDEAEGDASCSICMDRAPEAILLECGHGGLCMPCADSLWEQGPEGRLCPMCRKPITGIVKIVSENGSDVTVEVMHYSLAPSVETPADTGPRLFRRFLSGHGRNASAASQAISQEGTSGANVSPQVIFEVRNIEAPAPVGQEQQSSQERGASN